MRFDKSFLAAASILLAITLSFADTLYLRDGKEIKDATIVEIGVSEVKYRIGKKEVLYTAKKSDIAIIFYADGSKETFADDGPSKSESPININVNQNNNQNVNQNVNVGSQPVVVVKEPPPTRCGFTAGERWGTWWLNFIPGLGSIAVMDDWSGARMQWILVGGGLAAALVGEKTSKIVIIPGIIAIYSWPIYNTYRSYSYCKPGSTACKPSEGFNLAVIPNRHGNLMPAVMYKRGF